VTTKPRPNQIAASQVCEAQRTRRRTPTHSIVRILRRDIAADHYALLVAARY